jgi:anti-sigma-K factor RskA
MKLDHPELQSRLAAEYVLGTMRGRARRRFEDYLRMPAHRALRDAVAKWEAHLTPLAGAVPEMDPPKRVWARLEAQLFSSKTPAMTGASSQNAPKTPANQGFFGLGFWRSLGLGASSLAGVLLVVVFMGLPKSDEPMLTAVLEDQGGARLVIDQRQPDQLEARLVRNWNPSNEISHELWVIPADGAPRSLGLVSNAGNTTIKMAGLSAKLAGGAVFAVSLEPPGGSPTGAPTGRVVCKGAIAKMPPKVRSQI